MLRVVFDTSIVVSALRSRSGASNLLLRHVVARRIRPLVTTALLFEYEAVLKRSEHQLVHKFTIDGVDRFLSAFSASAEGVDVNYRWRPQLSDPDDELILEAAINGRAHILVTHNIRDFRAATSRFQLRVVTPGALVEELKT